MQCNTLYSPYGTYELKAKYQRNLSLATLITLLLVASVFIVAQVISAMSESGPVKKPPIRIETEVDLGPPPGISKKPPQVNVTAPKAAAPRVGIPTPVADDEVLDDNVVIPTRDELAEIVPQDIASMVGDGEITVDFKPKDFLPKPGDFVPVEIYPEFVYRHQPDYPWLAKQAGITGTVTIWVIVNEEGDVIKAEVYKSSGNQSLDEAAVQAAYKCKFKPNELTTALP
jgi:TonB family protein